MVRRDKRKKNRWYFRITVKTFDGKKLRVFGTPGIPGPYQDLPNSKEGATEAERRTISTALTGKSLVAAPTIAAAPAKTIGELAPGFLTTYRPESKPSTKRDRKVLIKRLLPSLGHLTPTGVEQGHVDKLVLAELERGMKIKTINNTLACLSCLITYTTGKKPQDLRLCLDFMDAEIHAVDPADVDRLLTACTACKDGRARVVILLASDAGLRAGEIRGLQWPDVKDGQLTVRRALDGATNAAQSPKHDKWRIVPMSPRLAEAIALLPRRGQWIVSGLNGDAIDYDVLARAIAAIYDRAGVAHPPKILHCLRHTFGTVMARKTPLHILKELMGHENIQTTLRYVHVNEKDKRDAIALVFGERASTGNNDDVK